MTLGFGNGFDVRILNWSLLRCKNSSVEEGKVTWILLCYHAVSSSVMCSLFFKQHYIPDTHFSTNSFILKRPFAKNQAAKTPSISSSFSRLVTTEDGAGYQKSGHSCADGSLPLVMAVAHPAAEGGVWSFFVRFLVRCGFFFGTFRWFSVVVFWVGYERVWNGVKMVWNDKWRINGVSLMFLHMFFFLRKLLLVVNWKAQVGLL